MDLLIFLAAVTVLVTIPVTILILIVPWIGHFVQRYVSWVDSFFV